jgi:hypothetical protein
VVVSTSRVVAVLTGVVFGPAAALIVGWLAKHFPGLPIIAGPELSGLMGAAFLGVVALGHKWLDGRSKFDMAVASAVKTATTTAKAGVAVVDQIAPAVVPNLEALVRAEVAKVLPPVPDAEEAAAPPPAAV